MRPTRSLMGLGLILLIGMILVVKPGGGQVRSSSPLKVAITQEGETLVIDNGIFRIEYDLDRGVWDGYWGKDSLVLSQGYAGLSLSRTTISTLDEYQRDWESRPMRGGREVRISHHGNLTLPQLTLIFRLYGDHLDLAAVVANTTGKDIPLGNSGSFSFGGELKVGDDPRSGRWRPPHRGDYEVIQMGDAHSSSLLDDIVYDARSQKGVRLRFPDGPATRVSLAYNKLTNSYRFRAIDDLRRMVLEKGESIESHGLRIELVDAVIGAEAKLYARSGRVSHWPHVPSGWCSWYQYYWEITEDEVIKVLDFASSELKPYGLEYIQIDDGWQVSPAGDWEPNQKFPHGMKWLAAQIHKRGLKAGIWLQPFMVHKESRLFRDHPDWVLKRGGRLVYPWDPSIYAIDPSNPEVKQWLKALFTKVVDWGYDYVKLDNVWFNKYGDNAFEKDLTAVEAYRGALEVIAGAMEGRFIAGRMLPMPPICGAGLAHSMRNHSDVAAHWKNIVICAKELSKTYFMHSLLWITDPDCLVVRPPLALDQARVWASIQGLTGGLMMLGDKLYELPPERLEIIKKVLPVYNIRPKDLFPHKSPEIWVLKINKDFGSWDVVGIVNWKKKSREMTVNFSNLGLDPKGSYLLYDFWEERFLGKFTREFSVSLRGNSIKVLSIHPDRSIPQVISTNRHITQGGVDLKEINWDSSALTLSGCSEGVKKADYKLVLYLPAGYRFESATVNGSPCEVLKVAPNLLELRYNFGENTIANWRIHFESNYEKEDKP